MDWIENSIEKYNQEVYFGVMPVANRSTLRSVLKKEEKFWERHETLEDRMTKWTGL